MWNLFLARNDYDATDNDYTTDSNGSTNYCTCLQIRTSCRLWPSTRSTPHIPVVRLSTANITSRNYHYEIRKRRRRGGRLWESLTKALLPMYVIFDVVAISPRPVPWLTNSRAAAFAIPAPQRCEVTVDMRIGISTRASWIDLYNGKESPCLWFFH